MHEKNNQKYIAKIIKKSFTNKCETIPEIFRKKKETERLWKKSI